MTQTRKSISWEDFKANYFSFPGAGISLNLSYLNMDSNFLESKQQDIETALKEMNALESGEIANQDENRMVGHYWLRNSELAPSKEVKTVIDSTLKNIDSFAQEVHSGKFKYAILIGMGGSSLGPKFILKALKTAKDPIKIFFINNTDPDGISTVLAKVPDLSKTLCIVISKSGKTKETRNGMLLAQSAWAKAGVEFSKTAIAVTGEGSELEKKAKKEKWLASFPMWDWVGGRTSVMSAVGLLPAALQGINTAELLRGASEMDQCTRSKDLKSNPAMLLALSWFHAGCGKGIKNMVVIPYSDRLELFSRYLQQLIMESVGKELDREGEVVNQGLTVFGNKGSTDQHAYIQQLREGKNDFFVTFIKVLKSSNTDLVDVEVDPDITAGDYLNGFLLGTRAALYEKQRESITITISEVNPYSIGALIALFERAIGFYASFIDVNAYHQPGVEAGKKAAGKALELQGKITELLKSESEDLSIEEICKRLKIEGEQATVFEILHYLSTLGRVNRKAGQKIFEDTFSIV